MSATMHEEPMIAVRRTEVLNWGTVRAGLGISFFGTLLAIISPVLLAFIGWTMRDQTDPSVMQVVFFLCALIGWLAGGILFITGACMGAAAPAESGVRGWSIGVCFLGPLSVIMLVLLATIGAIELKREGEKRARETLEGARAINPDLEAKTPLPELSQSPFGPKETRAIVVGFEAVCLLALLCHLLALRAVASSFQRSSLSIAVACFMMSSVVWVAGVNFAWLREDQMSEDTIRLLVLLVGAGLIILQLWYLALAAMVRGAIGEGLRPT